MFGAPQRSGIIGSIIGSVCALIFACFGFLIALGTWQSLQTTKAMQSWITAPCIIVTSTVEEDGEDFHLALSYTYSIAGKEFTGDRYSHVKYLTNKSFPEINKARTHWAEGSKHQCHYNPKDLSEVVIQLPSVSDARAAFVLSMAFPVMGLLLAAVPWIFVYARKKRKASHEDNTEVAPKFYRPLLTFMGAIFVISGLTMLKPVTIDSLMLYRNAQKWNSVTAIVVSRKVQSGSKNTHKPYIAYRYEIGGKEYYGDRFKLIETSSSGTDSKAEIVRQHPKGREFNVYVNPDDPEESVITRKADGDLFLCLIIPLPFIFAGIVLLHLGLRKEKTALDMCQSKQNTIDLKGSSGTAMIIASLVFLIIWTAIVFFIFLTPDTSAWLTSLFAASSGIPIFLTIHSILAAVKPKLRIQITPGKIHPGTDIVMQWHLRERPERIRSLSIVLQCHDVIAKTTHCGGSQTTQTVKRSRYRKELLLTEHPSGIMQGNLQFNIPKDQPASRPGKTNGIEWTLILHGALNRRPDMSTEFPFIVYPND